MLLSLVSGQADDTKQAAWSGMLALDFFLVLINFIDHESSYVLGVCWMVPMYRMSSNLPSSP